MPREWGWCAMPKNHERFEYYDVAVPRSNTLLLSYLREVHGNTNTPESQLLVQLATERVKQLCGDGPPATFVALGPLQAAMASMLSVLPTQGGAAALNGMPARAEIARAPDAVQALSLITNGSDDGDLDAYGDPD